MPILKQECHLFPADLLSSEQPGSWRVIYTRSNREKDLMRRLLSMSIPFYCPIAEQRYRSPKGRLRTSFKPLFSNYVFTCATDEQRYEILTTNCVSTISPVSDAETLCHDLRNLEALIASRAAVTLEQKLEPGESVRVKSGPFKGCEGTIIQRRGVRRLLVAVQFLEQGVSVELEDFSVERC